MSEENAGLEDRTDANGGGSGAGTDVTALRARISELENQVTSLQGQLAEQRNIQAGLDRSNTRKSEQINDLQEQLNRYKSITESDSTALEEITSERNTLSERVSELEGVQAQYEQLQQTHNRWRLLMEHHPELSYLAANDAMPAAESDEEFVKKLDAIAGSVGSAAEGQARDMLNGGRPPAQPPGGQGGEDPSDLKREAMRLYSQGKVDEGRELMDKYWAALEAQRN